MTRARLGPASDAGAAPWAEPGAWWLAGLSVVGLGIAAYLTSVHYAGVALACPSTGAINCEVVTTSAYSVVPGTQVPITVPGMAWFVLSLGLALAQLGQPERPGWRRLHAAWAGVGILTVFYLVYVELVRLHTVCLWCTGVHLVILATLITTVWRLAAEPPGAGEVRPSSEAG